MQRFMFVIIVIVIYLAIDLYAFQLFKHAAEDYSEWLGKMLHIGFWVSSILLITGLLLFTTGALSTSPRWLRTLFQGLTLIVMLPKLMLALFAFIDDIIRGVRWVAQLFISNKEVVAENTNKGISRLDFIAQTGVAVASVPIIGGSWGILSGAHDYRIRRESIVLPNLPKSFHGLRIVQLSDIHSGSFWNKRAVTGGVELALSEKPDVIFFTGDLVNDRASETADYQDVFSKIKAPMGVYSVLGNHDYGDYVNWASASAKSQNLKDLMTVQAQMGWQLLLDENVKLRTGSDEISVIGIQNWSAKGRFPKHGDLKKAYANTQNSPVKLLLSHDPSHWRAQVIPEYGDIDIMLAGHTHGAQFGIESGNLKWSPVKYMYNEWAGLYQQDNQYLYVNRGFGYLGFPGRLGILPEITVIELLSS